MEVDHHVHSEHAPAPESDVHEQSESEAEAHPSERSMASPEAQEELSAASTPTEGMRNINLDLSIVPPLKVC